MTAKDRTDSSSEEKDPKSRSLKHDNFKGRYFYSLAIVTMEQRLQEVTRTTIIQVYNSAMAFCKQSYS